MAVSQKRNIQPRSLPSPKRQRKRRRNAASEASSPSSEKASVKTKTRIKRTRKTRKRTKRTAKTKAKTRIVTENGNAAPNVGPAPWAEKAMLTLVAYEEKAVTAIEEAERNVTIIAMTPSSDYMAGLLEVIVRGRWLRGRSRGGRVQGSFWTRQVRRDECHYILLGMDFCFSFSDRQFKKAWLLKSWMLKSLFLLHV